ncbi:MAG: GtrA family protein [Alcaligenaceae bacterium]|nr:MAG: GtrA family protein [Alcaligenaceae bacterium]
MVGVVNTAVGYGVIFGCMLLLHWGPLVSNVAGYAVGLVVSFTLNRRFTFRSQGAAHEDLMRFLLIFGIAWLSNFAVLALLVRSFGVHEGVAQVAAGVVYFVLSFVLNKYYVFRPR